MSDSPAAILYTLMQKKKSFPSYELIIDGTLTRCIPRIFTYQVTCDGLVKTGSGSSKKEAKHNAAKAILEEISSQADSTFKLSDKSTDSYNKEFQSSFKIMKNIQPDAILQFPIDEFPKKKITPMEDSIYPKLTSDSSSLNVPKALENVCIRNNFTIPKYNIKKFSNVFQVECIVSSFKETATEETLVKAMIEAARKTWAKLQIECQKEQRIKQEEENFNRIIHSAECVLQSFSGKNQIKKEKKKSRRRNSEFTDWCENSSKKSKLLEIKKEDTNLTQVIFDEPINVPLFNSIEILNQMCNDINLQKPDYKETIADSIVTVTCTISTFKTSANAKTKNEAKYEVARKMIEKIQNAVQKLQNSEEFDLQCEDVKFFVNGTVMGMLETISHQNHSSLSSPKKSIKIENDDYCVSKKKIKSKNSIKMLKELCKNNNFKKPHFEIVEDNLFYSDNYKVACIVSSFKEESEGTCIEEAKIKSAQKMLEKFTKLQNSYLKQLICSVKKLDYKNPLRWKSKVYNEDI